MNYFPSPMPRITFAVFLALGALAANAARLGDLTVTNEVATLDDVVAATNGIVIPNVDLTPATNYTDQVALEKENLSPEWRSATVDRITTTASTLLNPSTTNTVGDIGVIYTDRGTFLALDLRAVRLNTEDGAETEIAGEWSIIAGQAHASLDGATLVPTSTSGPVVVAFEGEDGTDLRATFSMQHAKQGERISEATIEAANTWRRTYADRLATYFSFPTNGPAHSYRHSRGDQTNTYCRILDSQQLYTYNEVANPSVVTWVPFSFFNCFSVGRTDFTTTEITRPVTFISEHYAICANHYRPQKATFCVSSRSSPTFQTFSFSRVASRGDLCILRTTTAAFPTNYLPYFVRHSDLLQLSSSCLTNTLGIYQSQHGTFHPCVVTPLTSDGGWSTASISSGRNLSYMALMPYEHIVHGGDSGHAVFLPVIWNYAVLVGLYSTAGGSGESLVDESVQTWLSSIIRADSGGAEDIQFIRLTDLGQ